MNPCHKNIYTERLEFAKQFELIKQISINRKLLIQDHYDIYLTARFLRRYSNADYGAYFYVLMENVRIIVNLLCAKLYVSLLKSIIILRLELCGTLLLAKLYHEAINALNILLNKTIFLRFYHCITLVKNASSA